MKPDPVIISFGVSETSKNLLKAQYGLLSYGLLCAKKLILQHWKGEELPSFSHWITILTDTLHLEKIRYVLSDRLEEYKKVWSPF